MPRFIDPVGNTMFNHLQIAQLLDELEQVSRGTDLSKEEQRRFGKLKEYARRCREEYLYLKFIGD